MRRCRAGGVEIGTGEKICRGDECPFCGRDLHSCLDCRHCFPSTDNQCLERVAEWVSARVRASSRDPFSRTESSGPRSPGTKRIPEEEARKRWKKLFNC